MALLDLLKKEGNLTDVYSQEFFARQPTYDEDPDAPFYKNSIGYIEELEVDPSENAKPKNHLLFIFVDEYKKELIENLLDVYPPLVEHFKVFHKPDFLILNLFTRQMLCVGFGRKNRIFVYDPSNKIRIDFFGITAGEDEGKYLDKFIEHDTYEAVRDFAQALATLSQAMFDYDNLPSNSEMVEGVLDDEPKEDGLYYPDEDCEDDGYTREEIENFIEQYEDAQSRVDEAMKMINVFFPQCERGELNTGDY